MTDLTRVPVVVGGGQFTNRNEDPETSPDPFELMTEAAGRPPASAGSKDWLARLTHCWMVHSCRCATAILRVSWRDGIGAPAGVESRCSGMGGNIPQWLVNRAADLVRSGAATRRAHRRSRGSRDDAGGPRRRESSSNWPSSGGWPDMWPPLEPDMGVHPLEDAHGLRQATTVYALIESAIAHSAGEDRATHNRAIGS